MPAPALIKVREIGQIDQHFYWKKILKLCNLTGKEQNVCVEFLIFRPKGSFSSSSLNPYYNAKHIDMRYILFSDQGVQL